MHDEESLRGCKSKDGEALQKASAGYGKGESGGNVTGTLKRSEIEEIGDLGNEFDDAEGWMRERADDAGGLPSVPHPTRAALLLHRLADAVRLLRTLGGSQCAVEETEKVGEASFIAAMRDLLGHDVIGPDGGEIRDTDDKGGH